MRKLDLKVLTQIFDYRPPSFTPCSVNCPEATKTLESWKDAIDSLDLEAGKELVYFNRNSYPERIAHGKYLEIEGSRRRLKAKLRFLESV